MNLQQETIQENQFRLNKDKFSQIEFRAKDVNMYLDGPEDAPKLIFIHGFNFFVEMYSTLINKLIQKYRVLAIDLPGHGKTSQFEDYPIDLFIESLQAALDYNKFTDFSIVGHSMGGLLTLVSSSHQLFQKYHINKIIAFCPAGVKAITSFGQQCVKANCCTCCLSDKSFYKILMNETQNRSFKHFQKSTANNLMKVAQEYYQNEIHKLIRRTINQVQHFPWDNCQEQFIQTNQKFKNQVHVFLATNDKYVNTKKTQLFISQKCENFTLTILNALHELPILHPEYCYAQIAQIIE